VQRRDQGFQKQPGVGVPPQLTAGDAALDDRTQRIQPACPECLASEPEWTTASGKGRVISWVIYHHAYHEAFKERLPYNVALVELDEGPRLITNIVNPEAGLKAERPVTVKIEDEHGVALARFALV